MIRTAWIKQRTLCRHFLAMGTAFVVMLACAASSRAQSSVPARAAPSAGQVACADPDADFPDKPEPQNESLEMRRSRTLMGPHAPNQGSSVSQSLRNTHAGAYTPITTGQLWRWAFISPLWPRNLLAGVFVAGFGTALDTPHEYGPHWRGYAERFGIRLTGLEIQNVMEAGVDSLWGEDPRYSRLGSGGFKARMGNVVKMTFEARRRDGGLAPAYARYMAIPGSNFLSNTWREPSEADTDHALIRTGEGFAGRMISNFYREFWPDVTARVFRRSARD